MKENESVDMKFKCGCKLSLLMDFMPCWEATCQKFDKKDSDGKWIGVNNLHRNALLRKFYRARNKK